MTILLGWRIKMANKVLQRQWKRILRREDTFVKNATKKKNSKMEDFLAEKVPDKLQNTLNVAFAKSFEIVFERGTNVIEKTYNKESIQQTHKINEYAFSVVADRKRVNAINQGATKTAVYSTVISGVKGVSLGILGIGLPDIPIFMGMVFRGIYEIALQYGYNYDTEEERYFILNIISTALAHGEQAIIENNALNDFMLNPKLPYNYSRQTEIEKVSDVLSMELLYLKFVQGVPVIGAVGGVFDAVFTQKILGYAKLKYRRRFLSARALNEKIY